MGVLVPDTELSDRSPKLIDGEDLGESPAGTRQRQGYTSVQLILLQYLSFEATPNLQKIAKPR